MPWDIFPDSQILAVHAALLASGWILFGGDQHWSTGLRRQLSHFGPSLSQKWPSTQLAMNPYSAHPLSKAHPAKAGAAKPRVLASSRRRPTGQTLTP